MILDTYVVVRVRYSSRSIVRSIRWILSNWTKCELLTYNCDKDKLEYKDILGLKLINGLFNITSIKFIGDTYTIPSTYKMLTSMGFRDISKLKGTIIKSIYGEFEIDNLFKEFNTNIQLYYIESDNNTIVLSNGSILLQSLSDFTSTTSIYSPQ